MPLGDVRQYLGIQVDRSNDGRFSLNQQSYIQRLASHFGLHMTISHFDGPGLSASNVGVNELPNNVSFSSLVGGLLYTAINMRPDVPISVSLLGWKLSVPDAVDWTEVKRILRFM